jgi:HD superfamily phosphohydrolase
VSYSSNKLKIVNDPVYGFISIPGEFIYDVIQHPWLQRMRNIRQLGLTSLVYPGATHSRFQHALGAMHLTTMAIETLRTKGVKISTDEEEATLLAILLHDTGHGPFSHALENSIINGIKHEEISLLLMNSMNEHFNGRLTLAIEIFKGTYSRNFFHELIAGQVDMDRLDYLRRDSFFTGVIEGSVGSDRIIRMLNVADGSLVIDEKGIYSLEKFLIARRLMYWQVYMHKTVLSAESMLVKVLNRARELAQAGADVYASPALRFFLYNTIGPSDISGTGAFPQKVVAANFTRLDDSDILVSVKYWADSSDKVLSKLSERIIQRDLLAIELRDEPFETGRVEDLKAMFINKYGFSADLAGYFIFTGKISNLAYAPDEPAVRILSKTVGVSGIRTFSDITDHGFFSERVTKYFLCYPKELR